MAIHKLRASLKRNLILAVIFIIFLKQMWVGHTEEYENVQTTTFLGTSTVERNAQEYNVTHFEMEGARVLFPGVVMSTPGGLGNQMFRYACAYALSRRLNLPLYIPLPKQQPGSKSDLQNVGHRGLVLPYNFPITYLPLYSDEIVLNGSVQSVVSELDLLLDWDTIKLDGKFITSYSYCQSIEFFRGYETDIFKLFQQKLNKDDEGNKVFQSWLEKITASNNSVSIHIRRGDYFNEPLRLVPFSFYLQAVKMLCRMLDEESLNFYIFSDSIQLIKGEFGNSSLTNGSTNFHFISDPEQLTNLQEFYLMRSCSHNIISDSSYSWWAAWLNGNANKFIIAPDYPRKAIEKFGGGPKGTRVNLLIYNVLFYPRDWIVLKHI